MPASGLQPMEIWKIVAYIRSLRATASDAFVPGDVAGGERIFWEKGRCGTCHMIRGRGGISGPDLSNLAGERTLAAIRDALTKSRLQIPRGYQPVEVVTLDGRKITGIAKNDNNFSLQLLDSQDRLQLFTSDELRADHLQDTVADAERLRNRSGACRIAGSPRFPQQADRSQGGAAPQNAGG